VFDASKMYGASLRTPASVAVQCDQLALGEPSASRHGLTKE